MKPQDFEESNSPAYLTSDGSGSEGMQCYRGKPPGEEKAQIVTCWAPVRAEVEAMAQGKRIWMHVFPIGDKLQMPVMKMGCVNPFKSQTFSGFTSSEGMVIDEGDPLQMEHAAAALDAIKDMVLPGETFTDAERVVEQVAKLVHAYKMAVGQVKEG